MSYYDDASLVVIPSGYKTSKVYAEKPTDGSGDLAFTRTGDTATRVNSAGLIERVRTNLVLQSNTFSTTWINDNTTETSGQAGYDGTNNAWLLDSTGGFIQQNISLSGLYTFSVYAKKGTAEGIRLRINAGTDANCYINLNDGTEILAHSGVYLSVVSVGSGWYRIGLAINDSAIVDVRFYPIDLTGTSTTGNVLIQNSQLEAGDIATPYIPTLTAAVSVGMVANVPRLDYLGSTCPRLLLEPQRTNLVTFSEAFNDASWAKTRCTVTANAGTSPDGYDNADKFVEDSTNNSKFFVKSVTTVDSSSYTLSLFAKAAERNQVALVSRDKAGAFKTTVFGLTGGTIVSDQHTGTKIEDYGNGWYRCSVVFNSGTGATATNMYVQTALNGNLSYQGDGTSGILIYGAGWELGSYVTSYIPTLGASATRGADACSKTGISSLIGQTEGTAFLEFEIATNDNFDDDYPSLLHLSDGTTNNRLSLFINDAAYSPAKAHLYVRTTAGVQAQIIAPSSITTGRHKIAFAYASNDFVLYMDGVQLGTDTSGIVPACSVVSFTDPTGSANPAENETKQAIVFPTRLTNAQMAELTTL